jgi:DeoR/GlpR family transcriptional regulator of sugar metabolism
MEVAQRRAVLLSLLHDTGRVDVADAAIRFGTAEMTIRRDLDALVEQGAARRVRGGAISLLFRGDEPPFGVRSVAGADRKRLIARAAASLLSDGESVVLDSGTTTLQLAKALHGRQLTVMPMSLQSAEALAAQSSIRLLMPGGEVRPGELSLVGPLAIASLGGLRFDTAVLSCCGLAGGQVTAHDIGDAAVKTAMRASAARTVLLADSSKFARAAMAVVCETNQIDVIVTDGSITGEVADEIQDQGVELLAV